MINNTGGIEMEVFSETIKETLFPVHVEVLYNLLINWWHYILLIFHRIKEEEEIVRRTKVSTISMIRDRL